MMAESKYSPEGLIQVMLDKGYLLKLEDGKYSPSMNEPPEDEDEELRKFWVFLHWHRMKKLRGETK